MQQLFFRHLAQTTDAPMALEISHAKGIYLYTPKGNRIVDLVSGVGVSNVGHSHPKVLQAVQEQVQKHMHTMVYGEYIQCTQVQLAEAICELLPPSLSNVYLVNSGSEAIEGAMKLAKRYTQRSEIVAFKNAYHGSTQGALSIVGSEEFKQNFRPLLPSIRTLTFNAIEDLPQITERTACVVVEAIQAEAGVRVPQNDFLPQLAARCKEVGALLVLDEVQTGIGRTGTMFAFERYAITPDILVLGKAFGGGMPLGAFISSKEIMSSLSNPPLGHITTFGGHPVSCAAGLAAIQIINSEHLVTQVAQKSEQFKAQMQQCPAVQEVRGEGLLLAVEFGCAQKTQQFFQKSLKRGVAIDWFLFCNTAFRIAPPLTITHNEIDEVCNILHDCM
ncbi:MAG: aspartate aminotransferase family protein [Bacteroidales bacterium]